MNILKPELLWIEGRCYRGNGDTTEMSSLQEHDNMNDNELVYADEQGEEDDDIEVTMMDNSRYISQFHVPKFYLGSIIGKKGATKLRIERETNTNIKIPKPGESGDIAILGPSTSNVRTARRRVNMVVLASRMRQRATHFISIPMTSPEIVNNFRLFKEKVLSECPGKGLDESIFIEPEKLHLTMGVMCLMDGEERLQASKLLAEAKEKIIMPLIREHLPLKIRLKGVSYMNDDPSQIDVLFGNVLLEDWNSSDVLQTVGDAIVAHYYKAGFMFEEHGRQTLKLHVTLINSKYRKDSSAASSVESKSYGKRQPFDGTDILKNFADFDFGVMELKEIHLSQRHSVGADGFYQPTCIISCK